MVTVSSSRSPEDDRSGPRAISALEAAGHELVDYRIVPDGLDSVGGGLQQALRTEAEVIVFTGGTGFSPSDRTPEALIGHFERTIDGFGELFRQLSYGEIGAAAMLSRAIAGIVGQRVVYALPGSPPAVDLAMRELILPEAGHLLGQIRRQDTTTGSGSEPV